MGVFSKFEKKNMLISSGLVQKLLSRNMDYCFSQHGSTMVLVKLHLCDIP